VGDADAIGAHVAALLALPGDVFALRREVRLLTDRLEALTAMVPPALVDVAEAARRLGKSPSAVRRMAAEGVLPARRIGRSWRIDLAACRPATPEQVAELAREARAR
jgi:excisionase family DNA binding protein